jgi:hypothetical protein
MRQLILTIFFFLSISIIGFAQIRHSYFVHEFKSFRIYAAPYGDFMSVNRHFLTNILKPFGIPSNDILSGNIYGTSMFYMRRRLFTNLSMGASTGTIDLNDSLRLDRRSQFIGLTAGYNLILKQNFVLSPYAGFKFFRFRNITSQKEPITLAHYFQNKDVDLRINQFAATMGLNFSFVYKKDHTFGFYLGYLQNMHKNARLYATGTRIENTNGSPLNHWNFGLGYGFNSLIN